MSKGSLSRGKGGSGRSSQFIDGLRASFGFLPAVAMLIGLIAGLALPALDEALGITLPVLSFDGQSSARSLLQTIATATVSVVGLSFSVTVVAFTLASSQLSPRVLRSFRGDRLSQATLALLLGTFIYCLVVLVRLGISGEGADPPNLSMTVAVLLALASFVLFAVFISHILTMLQPSSVVAAIHDDARNGLAARFPSGPGAPEDEATARSVGEHAKRIKAGAPLRRITADGDGYLNFIDIGDLIEAALWPNVMIGQSAKVGSDVLPGQEIASVWSLREDPDRDGSAENSGFDDAVRDAFQLGRQRTTVQDIAFPVRQLADIALKGLSPGINDPTTSQNAMEVLTAVLIEFSRTQQPSTVRVDGEGAPRFAADPVTFDELIQLGFEEVSGFCDSQPLLARRLTELLGHLEVVAGEAGLSQEEISRQGSALA
ncbi:DUF2254 domain-containing protein [soil metagenome]